MLIFSFCWSTGRFRHPSELKMVGKTRLKFLPFVAVLCVLGLEIFPRLAQTQNAPQPDVPKVDYQKDIQPILEKNCYSCHGADGADERFASG